MGLYNLVYFPYMMYHKYMNIPLASGGFAVIDDEDGNKVSSYKWTSNKGYVQAVINRTSVRMHRLVLGLKKGEGIVDHINGDKSDNRRSNLRVCTAAENSYNRNKKITNKSGYKGVLWRKNTTSKNWCAVIYHKGKSYHLGYFITPLEAAIVYDREASKRFGEFARLNLPRGIAS